MKIDQIISHPGSYCAILLSMTLIIFFPHNQDDKTIDDGFQETNKYLSSEEISSTLEAEKITTLFVQKWQSLKKLFGNILD